MKSIKHQMSHEQVIRLFKICKEQGMQLIRRDGKEYYFWRYDTDNLIDAEGNFYKMEQSDE